MEVAATASSAPATPAAPTGRRSFLAAIAVLVVGMAVVAIVLLASVPSTRAARNSFNAATPYRCGGLTAPAGVGCWEGTDGKLVALTVGYSRLGSRQVVASVATASGLLGVVVEPATALVCARPGDPVVVRWSGSTVTTVFTGQGTLATTANPNIDPDTALQGGIALLAVAVLFPAGLTLAEMRRRRRGIATDVVEVYRAPVMRWALLAFAVGQAADVVTSAIGQATGLSEGNDIVDVFIRVTGPVGFLLFRLPAIALVLLALSQVPRRIAAITLAGLGAAFLAVGIHNAVLAAAGVGAGIVCGSGVPLP
jgi:hypothetical protein